MDVNQTWQDLALAVQARDWVAADEHAQNLLNWIRKDGFPPRITDQPQFDRIVAISACEAVINWDFD